MSEKTDPRKDCLCLIEGGNIHFCDTPKLAMSTPAPGALSREQVELLAKQLREYRQGTIGFSAVVNQVEATDAALRQTIEQQAQEMAQLAQRVKDCQREVGESLDRNNAVHAELAAMTQERDEAIRKHDELAAIIIGNKIQVQSVQQNRDLRVQLVAQEVQMNAIRYRAEQAEQQLAAMTQELGLARLEQESSIAREWHIKQQLAAAQARGKELESQHNDFVLRNRLLRDRQDLPMERLQAYEQFLQKYDELQATLAAREAAIESMKVLAWDGRQEALKERDTARQEVERLNRLLEIVMNELHNIASADVKEWDIPTDTEFKAWAQNRARHTHEQAQRALKGGA